MKAKPAKKSNSVNSQVTIWEADEWLLAMKCINYCFMLIDESIDSMNEQIGRPRPEEFWLAIGKWVCILKSFSCVVCG